MKYFAEVHTLDELKKAYKAAALANHPDLGGDAETMKAINNEYEERFAVLKEAHNFRAANPDNHTHATTEAPRDFIDIIEHLIHMDGLTVELCGCWLWIGGDTMKHKEELKACGCRWSSSKKLWSWHHPEDGSPWHRGHQSMDAIRSKYGSEYFGQSKEKDAIPA
jgi:hypothetical protein